MSNDHYITCYHCGNEQNVDVQVADINRNKKELVVTTCKQCGFSLTVVITMMGTRCLEGLILEKEAKIISMKDYNYQQIIDLTLKNTKSF